MRTAGNMNGFMDIELARRIAARRDRPDRRSTRRRRTSTARTRSCRCTRSRDADEARTHVDVLGRSRARRRSRPICRSRAPRSRARSTRRTARPEDDRPSLLGHVRRSRRSRDRQSRARLLRRDRLRRRQAARRLSRPGAGPADHRRARRERRAVQGAREEARGQERRAHVDADGFRDVHAGAADATRARCADAAAQASSSSSATNARRRTSSRCTRPVPEGDARSSARS